MKCSLDISDFFEEISSLSHSIVFFYFFALVAEEGFLISPCYSLELGIQMGISFLFSFAFSFTFSQLFVRPPQTAFCFFHLFFLRMVLIPVSCTILHSKWYSTKNNQSSHQHNSCENQVLVFFTKWFRVRFVEVFPKVQSNCFPRDWSGDCIERYSLSVLK